MGYLIRDALVAMGFAHLGKNVKISEKASIYEPEKIKIGDNSRIDDFCVVSGKVTIGRNIHFAPFCLVAGGKPGITFGDFSGLSYQVQVFSQSDDYSGATMTNPTVPDAYKNETMSPIVIGKHCIVGSGAIIVPGVTLHEGTAVGAKSLILQSTEPWSIYVGSPAKKLRNRSRELLRMEKDYIVSEI